MAQDVSLDTRRARFVETHYERCGACQEYDRQLDTIISAIQDSSLGHQGSPEFTGEVVVAISREQARLRQHPWRPVAIGAVTAAFALGAVLQVLTAQPTAPNMEGGAVRERRLDAPFHDIKPGKLNLFDTPSRMVEDPPPTTV
jgi:hypothetical protein